MLWNLQNFYLEKHTSGYWRSKMSTLYLAWRSKYNTNNCTQNETRWFPIGALDYDKSESLYRFFYLKGAEKARELAGFSALDAFPDFEKKYQSDELFEFFKNRVPNRKRRDFSSIVERMDLEPNSADPVSILSISGGTRQTDCLEIFPELELSEDGYFTCKFFVHGSRFMSDYSNAKLKELQVGDELKIAIEMNNPATGSAIQIQTKDDLAVIGYAPRYLLEDLKQMEQNPYEVKAHIAKVNLEPAPSNQRLLVSLSGKLPKTNSSMRAQEEFSALIH